MNRSGDHEALRSIFAISRKDNTGSINDLDDYKKIVSGPAYQDFTPRNIKGVTKKNKSVQKVLEDLATSLFEYIHDNNLSFNAWHEKTCFWFMDDYNKASGANIKAGKAQKIINMSFKYLFCLSDATNYADSFKDCHMPLDSYTIEWFCEEVLPMGFNKGKKRGTGASVSKIKEKSWSQLDYGNVDEVGSYAWIQDQIKEYLMQGNHGYIDEEGNPLSPFAAEFYIWPEQLFKRACKAFESNPLFNSLYPDYEDPKLNHYCKNLSISFERIKNKFQS